MPRVVMFLLLVFFNGAVFSGSLAGGDYFGNTFGWFKVDAFPLHILGESRRYIFFCIAAFAFGLWFGGQRVLDFKPSRRDDVVCDSIFGILFLCVSAIAMMSLMLRGVSYDAYTSGGAVLERFFVPFGVAGVSSLLLNRRSNRLILVLYIPLCFIFSIKTGARAEGLINIVPIFLWYLWRMPKAGYMLMPLYALMFLLIMSYIRIVRDGGLGVFNPGEALSAVLVEGGFSSNLVPMTFEYVLEHDFAYGINYLGAIFSVVPKLSFWMDHSSGSYALSSALGFYYDPYLVTSGYGLGGSMLAESYFAVGWFGLIAVFFYGYISMRLCAKRPLRKYGAYLALGAFGYLAFGIRQDLMYVIRGVAWYVIFPVYMYMISVAFQNWVRVHAESKNG